MGCASSHLLQDDEDYVRGAGNLVGHHIVSLTSTTYGLLTLDSPQRQTISTESSSTKLNHSPFPRFPSPLPEPRCGSSEPEIINSWELMEGLDNDSFRFSPLPKSSLLHTVAELDSRISRPIKPSIIRPSNLGPGKENNHRQIIFPKSVSDSVLKPLNGNKSEFLEPISTKRCYSLDGFERICPPRGENAVVIYTTTLRGVRKTFDDCNAVRAALEGFGVKLIERDISMHSGFREELKELTGGKVGLTVPRVFVKGRYIGGVDEVLRIHEEGGFVRLVEGLPKSRIGGVCDGCGGVRFLPCFPCSGSRKIVMEDGRVIRCPECNENGLVLCPICS